MKHTIWILLISVSGLFSCSDLLDKSPDGRISLEDVFKDNDRVAAMLNECYNYLPSKSLHYNGWTNFPTACCDESWAYAGDEFLVSYYNNTVTDANHPFIYTTGSEQTQSNMVQYWNRYFAQVRTCTQFLWGIDNATVDDERNRQRWKAEAYVLRAYYLSELVKWYGPIPLNDMKLYELTHDYSTAVRNSVWEVAEAIESDCRAAIQISDTYFPYRNQFVASQSGSTSGEELRVNKALAWTLMSKMYLFAASDLYNKGVPQEERTQRWKKAYEVNKEAVTALEANGYELFTNHTKSIYASFGKGAAFYQINASYDAPNVDKETIWQNNRRGVRSWALNSLPGLSGTDMYTAFWPSQELVDAFEVVEYDGGGNIISAEPLLDLASPYANGESGHLTPNFNSAAIQLGYDDTDPYAAQRDPRLYATVLRNGDKISWHGTDDLTVESYVNGAHGIVYVSGNSKNTKTGYYSRKFWAPGVSDINSVQDPAWKYFRLAEVKLNFAEAAIEYALAQGGNQAIQQEAATQMNAVRKRAGMPALPATVVSDMNKMKLRVRNERRVELAFEESRFFDVRRWADPDGDLSATDKFISGMEVTENAGTFTYKRVHVNKKDNGPTRAGGWQNKYLLLPINRADVILMQNATGKNWQNPGWN